MHSIEIAHRIKNGSIVVKFSDRPSRDALFAKKVSLKGITTANLGLNGDENSIFINEPLAFEAKKLLYKVKQKCREVGYHHAITDNGVKISSKKDLEKLHELFKCGINTSYPIIDHMLTSGNQHDLFYRSFGWLLHGSTTELRRVSSRFGLTYICYKSTSSIRFVFSRLIFFIFRILIRNVIGKMGCLSYMILI